MDYFNQSPEEKLNNYLEYNPEFPIYRPTVSETAVAPNISIDTPTDIFSNINRPTIAQTTNQEIINPIEEVTDAPLSPLDKLRGILSRPSKEPSIFNNAPTINTYTGPMDNARLKRQIAAVESDGMGGYSAQNPKSTAVGKYQFLWGNKPGKGWQDEIKRITGVQSKEEFKKNPNAQERFMDYYTDTTLKPSLQKIKNEFPNSGMTDMDIMKGIHFRGLGKADGSSGLRKILKQGLQTAKLEEHNATLVDYLKKTNTVN